MSSQCLWHACRALSAGLLLMLLGGAMAVIGKILIRYLFTCNDNTTLIGCQNTKSRQIETLTSLSASFTDSS